MKKVRITAVLMISVLLLSSCRSQEPELRIPDFPDVRNATWFMTMDEVIFCEGREPDEILDNALVYKNVRMEKIPMVDITYNFYNIDLINTDGTENLLSSVVFSFIDVRRLDQRMLHNSYIDIVEEYNKKYGSPVRDDRTTELTANGIMEESYLKWYVDAEVVVRSLEIGLNDVIQYAPFTFGRTARYSTEWMNEDETTIITLMFSYDGRGPEMQVRYEYIEPNNDI